MFGTGIVSQIVLYGVLYVRTSAIAMVLYQR